LLDVLDVTTTTDHTVTIAASILGGIYGVTAISAFLFIILPRMMAGQAAIQAARPAAGLPRLVRAARPLPQGTRWSPSYGHDMVRTRPGAYLPREQIELRRLPRVSTVPSRRVPVLHQVSTLHLFFVEQFALEETGLLLVNGKIIRNGAGAIKTEKNELFEVQFEVF